MSGGLARLAPTIERFRSRTVVVVGDLITDEYLFGKPSRISREAPVIILRFTEREVKLGGAANAAHNVHALGARVVPIGVVGRDLVDAGEVGWGRWGPVRVRPRAIRDDVQHRNIAEEPIRRVGWVRAGLIIVHVHITVPQDHTLFEILRETDAGSWRAKVAAIRERGGLALVLAHPDYARNPHMAREWRAMLEEVADDPTMWQPLPRDAARWWRNRAASHVVRTDRGWAVLGPAAGRAGVRLLGNPSATQRTLAG